MAADRKSPRDNGKGRGDRRSAPSDVVWVLATLSLVLPFVGVAFAGVGVWRLISGVPGGWPLVAIGIGCLVLDVVIDLWIAHPDTSASDEPELNQRAHQVVGRVGRLATPIEAGRGRLRLGDSEWTVEGPEGLPAGAQVRVVACRGVVLEVEPAD